MLAFMTTLAMGDGFIEHPNEEAVEALHQNLISDVSKYLNNIVYTVGCFRSAVYPPMFVTDRWTTFVQTVHDSQVDTDSKSKKKRDERAQFDEGGGYNYALNKITQRTLDELLMVQFDKQFIEASNVLPKCILLRGMARY